MSVTVQPAPVVNKVDVHTPDTMKMEVTAMPARETSSTVVRDDKGDIKSTTQIEKDKR